ncbi:type I polyketide synthase [Streptomyces sp. NPDC059063]|uniref:type I polyketide synthase n=1 Tax=unclassified Streptomyces TaxID=2593676 RepID=UPI0036B9A217
MTAARSAAVAVAVVGLSFRFPGADTPDEFWRTIRTGASRIRRFTDAELAAAGVPEEQRRAPGFVGASGVLDDITGFDAGFFGMSAREAQLTDPQQRLFLECVHHALEDAGYAGTPGRGQDIGVYASTGYHLYCLQTYLQNNVLPSGAVEDWVTGLQVSIGSSADFTATRVAYRLGLTGPAISVQTACSSSLTAVQLAAQAVAYEECGLAVAGATAVHVPQVLGYPYVKGSILSKSGRIRPFDAAADGTVGGTGVAAVVLKRLDRALADGDHIHGVIRGWGVNNDGAGKRTYTAPSADGQRQAVRRALARAGVTADSIGYLETHGTGTLKGDPIELAGATAAFREDTERSGYCALGSVKANIGHLDVCSGLASLIKALLVLRHGVIPPLAGYERPNPALDLAAGPFYVPDTARPWPDGDVPRRAGVSSFGVGGTNVHVVLEQAPAPLPRPIDVPPPPGVLLVSGHTGPALTDNARALRDHLRAHPRTDLADLVTTTALGRAHGRHRIALRGDSVAALTGALDTWLTDGSARGTGGGDTEAVGVGFLFAGQGSTYRGMARPLYERFPVVRDVLDSCAQQYRDLGGDDRLLDRLLHESGDGDDPWPTELAQPGLFAFQCALVELWRAAGITPGAVAGHSVGEYAALYAAGALSREDGLRLTAERGRLMRAHCAPGAMAAVRTTAREAAELAAEVPGVELAVTNGAEHQVLAGPVDAMGRLTELLSARGLSVRTLPVRHAFHTALMAPVLGALRDLAGRVTPRPVDVPFVSGLDGRTRPPGWRPDADYFVRQAREPVRFADALAELGRGAGESGLGALVEIGPHTTLTGLARRALPGLAAHPTLRRGAGLAPLWDAAAGLHRAGAAVDWRALTGGAGRRIPLPGYRFQHKHYWTGPENHLLRAAEPAREPARDGDDVAQDEAAAVDRVLRHVIKVIAEHLSYDTSELTPDASFFDLGADSLQMIGALRELEDEHRVKVSMRELFEEAGTARKLARIIVRKAGREPSYEGTAEPAYDDSDVYEDSVRPAYETKAEPAYARREEPVYATREEVADLARQIKQLSQMQLQLMGRLSQLLAAQAPAGSAAVNGRVAP